jgi:hypothetical protein
MNYNYINHSHKSSSKDLVNLTTNFFTESGLKDNFFLDLCRAKTDTDIRGRLVNISVIVPDKEGAQQVTKNKYFDYAMKKTPTIIIGKRNHPFIIDKEDIRPDIIKQLESLHTYFRQNIIKQAVLRIFEITSPQICYLSIAPRLKVEIKGLKK